ncbi:hypothetical protein E0H73_11310 [Kribbella pittospori]|uniref:Uncharacterized protein n=1 Tax=Kribbella pittospori TaxID=722689 RepID=A0A4R0KQE0_9ACTN|nr:hypothetical protein [Kribbella pittospori]TCC63061.1 hypothetical protein E0H73_11310 [Kribbella pittospori]
MSFNNLPPTWTTQPLSDPARAADVVDLMVTLGDRRRGTFTVLLCDPDNHYRAALTLDLPEDFAAPLEHPTPLRDVDQHHDNAATAGAPHHHRAGTADAPHHRRAGTADAPHHRRAGTAGACSSALDPILPAVRTAPGTGLILALGRPGPPFQPEVDTEWAEAATRICQAADVRLLGFYVASANHVYQPQLQTRAAA